MSKLCNSAEIRGIAKSEAGVFVLFYAEWCPFSRAFLQVYEKRAHGREAEFFRVALDGNEPFFDEHRIEVYPTVIFFRGGRVHRRLDGKHMVGLNDKQLTRLISSCDEIRGR